MPTFWLKTNWWVVSHLPTHLTSLFAILLSPRMNQDLKGRRFADTAEVQWESMATLAAFPLKILDNVSSSGSSTGIIASNHRGNTLKMTKVSKLCKYFKYIFLIIPGIFWSHSHSSRFPSARQKVKWSLYWCTSLIFYKNLFLKIKVHHCHHRSSPTDPVLTQFNPVCISKASLGWNSVLNVFSHLHLTGPISRIPPATTVCISWFNTLHCGKFKELHRLWADAMFK